MINLIKGEFKKNLKKGSIITLSIIYIALIIVTAVAFNVLKELSDSIGGDLDGNISVNESHEGKIYKEEEIDSLIAETKDEIEFMKEQMKKDKRYDSELKYAQSKLKAYEYIKRNKLFGSPVSIVGIDRDITEGLTAEKLVDLFVKFGGGVAIIYAIILGARLFADEYKSGTIKMLMSRPLKRSKITGAKMIMLLSAVAFFVFVPTLIIYLYGLIAYPADGATKVLTVFNGTSAYTTTVSALVFGEIMEVFLEAAILGLISFCLGTLTRKPSLGLIISLVVFVGGGLVTSLLGIAAFTLSNAFEFMNFFTVSASVPIKGNFFISLTIMAVWTAAAIATTFLVVDKRDV